MRYSFRLLIACVFISSNASASLSDELYRAVDGVIYNGPVIICAAGTAALSGILSSNPAAREIDWLRGPFFWPMTIAFFGTLLGGNYLLPVPNK